MVIKGTQKVDNMKNLNIYLESENKSYEKHCEN